MIFKRLKRVFSLITAVALISTVASSCKKSDDDFPDLSYPEDTSVVSETVSGTEETTEPLTELTIAVPYSSDTVDLLVRLYYAKETGIIDENYTGDPSDIDFLRTIDIPWIITSRLTTAEGAGLPSILEWEEAGELPDLMLVEDLESVKDTGLICPYDEYLATDSNINGNAIYPDALMECMFSDGTYGLPHYLSVMLLIGNSEYIPESGRIPFRTDTQTFLDYLRDIKSEDLSDDMTVFAGAYELLPYLSSAFNNDVRTPYMFEGETSDPSALNDALDYIDTIYDEDLSAFSDLSGADPRISRSACMWMSSSGSIDRWLSYYPEGLYFAMLPSDNAESSGIPYASIYSMCMSEECGNKELAASLAEFMCFDTDALKLIYSQDPQRGYLPCVTSSSVWDLVCDDDVFGTEAMLFEQIMSSSVYCPGPVSDRASGINNYNRDYFIARSSGDDTDYDLENCLS